MSKVIHGAWRTPVNIGAGAAGTIHDDAEAQRHGFAGGTVAGSIHMEQYWGLLSKVFGPDWIAHGGLSLWFMQPTISGEPVRCSAVRDGDDADADVWMENRAGDRISEGTADFGRAPGNPRPTEFTRRRAALRPSTTPNLLDGVAVGHRATGIPAYWSASDVATRRAIVTEDLPGYAERPPVLPTDLAINLMRLVEPQLVTVPPGVIGLYGAIELRTFGQPVRADTDYTLSGEVLAIGQTPRSETFWYRSDAHHQGRPAAQMLHMARLLCE